MSQPTRTEAIKAFLSQYAPPDLGELYNYNMEVQIIVAKGNGERIEGDFKGRPWHAYTNGIQTWKPIRIPLNANTEPTYEDRPITYDLSEHAEGIGMTGWDWVNKQSRWVAFDFDAITGHSDKHAKKLNDNELQAIRNAVHSVPWVTIRKSTGGKGLHLYVFLEPTHTANHNEHAAVGRAILSYLSGICSFDFGQKVDICGGNMWVWHRKMKGTGGLELLKASTELAPVPVNWRDYTKVVNGHRQRNLPRFIEEQKHVKPDIEDIFDELTGQRLRLNLDHDHKLVLNWLTSNYPNSVWWDAEHHMMVTHTALLKECHEALTLRGPYETLAAGTEKGYDINCFLFPIARGAWAIRRYTLGVTEHAFWEQDGAGWTRCFFNRDPDLASAARVYEGLEDPAGGYCFKNAEQAQKAALLLGADLNLPNWTLGKKTKLLLHKSGRLTVEIDKETDSEPINGWLVKGKKFIRMFNIKANAPGEPDALRMDEQIRHLVSSANDDCGWVVRSEGQWHSEPYNHVQVYLKSLAYNPKDVATIMGASIMQCWKLVNKPFQPEYPKDREWNRGAAQFRYKPKEDRDSLNYPTWLSILEHCGKGLDEAVKNNGWAKANGILTGADYLKIWIASLFQCPQDPLPYLFLYGEQNSGKSILHEALSLLVTHGVARADNALVSQSGFNGELEHAVVCVVEETDLRKNSQAYNRIKDWVTSREIPIHKKMKQPYTVPNTTHWIHCANSHLFCPVFPGDTRITMIYVDELDPAKLIPKKTLIPMLQGEAPDFMAEILGLELPASNDRLNIPVLNTEEKKASEFANQSMLEIYCDEKLFSIPGHTIKFSDFYDKFVEWLDPNLISYWTKIRVGKEMPRKFPKGRVSADSGQFYLGNAAWEKCDPKKKLMLKDGKLITQETENVEPVSDSPKAE